MLFVALPPPSSFCFDMCFKYHDYYYLSIHKMVKSVVKFEKEANHPRNKNEKKRNRFDIFCYDTKYQNVITQPHFLSFYKTQTRAYTLHTSHSLIKVENKVKIPRLFAVVSCKACYPTNTKDLCN